MRVCYICYVASIVLPWNQTETESMRSNGVLTMSNHLRVTLDRFYYRYSITYLSTKSLNNPHKKELDWTLLSDPTKYCSCSQSYGEATVRYPSKRPQLQ